MVTVGYETHIFYSKMKSILLLFCYLLFICNSGVLGQNADGCSIGGLGDQTLELIRIKDTEIGVDLKLYPYNDTLFVNECTGDTYSYFNIATRDSYLVISTTESFADFDKNTPKSNTNIAVVTVNCRLTCTGETTFRIQFQVTDTNNHPPTFSSSTYEIRVPVPIMPLTDFSVYGDSIVATDIDFSNQNVTFSIEPNDFSIETSGTETEKDYTAVFAARSIIQINGNKEYTITATDTGTPPLSATSTINLIVDENLSFDTPSFGQLSYSFNYSLVNNNPSLKPNDDPITITTNKPSAISNPTLTGEYSGYFEAKLGADKTVEITTNTESLPKEVGPFIILTLGISTDSDASTAIIIYLSSDINAAPEFSSHYYIGRYDEVSNEVILNETIKITSPRTPDVTISGEFANHFEIKYDEKTSSCVISTKNKFTVEELKGRSYIELEVEASIGNNYDTAMVILSLSEHVLQFTKALYTATYNTNNTVSIGEDPIAFTTTVDQVKITTEGDYAKNFEITSEEEKYIINVVQDVTEDVFKTQKEILLTLLASDSYGNKAQTVIAIALPGTTTDAIAFSQTIYWASYTYDSKSATVTTEKDIVISNRDQSLVTIKLDSYNEYFRIAYADNKWSLEVKKLLDEDILNSKQEIAIALTASEEDSDLTAEAVVIINWSIKEAPQFEEEYYKGLYPKTGKGVIELDKDIEFTNVETSKDIKIVLQSYMDNFKITYDDASNKWVLKVETSLNTSVLTENTELTIILSATENDNKKECHTVLILDLPSDPEEPKFEYAYYTADYPESGSGDIELDKPIKFTNIGDPSSVEISLDKFSDNFAVKYESEKWLLSITEKLLNKTLEENQELLITLTATDTTNGNQGQAALVVKLPSTDDDDTTVMKFSKPYYTADYPESGTGSIQFETPVEIENINDITNVQIVLDSHSDNFEIKYSDKWYIEIKKSLDTSEVKENAELVLALIATDSVSKSTARSALVLRLPDVTSESAPEFSSPHYLAKYPVSGSGTIEFEDTLSILNVDDQSIVVITVENYEEYLEVKYESGKWQINIVKSFDESMITDDPEIVATLIAVKTGKTNTGKSALVLQLPLASNDLAPIFEHTFYYADYPENSEGTIDFDKAIAFSNIDDVSSVTITLDNYSDNLKVTFNDNKWQLTIIKPFNDSVLKNNAELYITLIATAPDYSQKGYSALVLKLPSNETSTNPIFSKAYYVASYPKTATGSIEFEAPIEFSNVEDPSTLEITLDNYEQNFQVIYDGTKWYIYIKTALDDEILKVNSELVATLIAKYKGSKKEGYSALVLKLPQDSNAASPEFSEAFYIADYKDDVDIIEFTNPITFQNLDDPITQIVLDDYTEYFEIKNKEGNWYISVKNKLPDSITTKNAELVTTMKAEGLNSDPCYSALVLRLPSDHDVSSAPEFSKAYYLAKYPTDDATTIEFENPITFKNVDDQNSVKITLDDYANNFEILYGDDKWYISIKNKLSEDILNKNSELVVTLTAVETGNTNEGYSALVIELPVIDTAVAPKFSDAYYIAKYPENNETSVEITNAINFANSDPKTITIKLDNYIDNFEVTYQSGKWILLIKKAIDDEILKTNKELVVTMIASETDNQLKGYAVLVIELPVGELYVGPLFSEAYYLADYPETYTGIIEFKSPITFKNVDDFSKISIALESYKENFDVVLQDNVWVLNVKKMLDSSVVQSTSEIVLTLTATDTSINKEGYSALVIRLYNKEEIAPIFSKPVYTASYTVIDGEGQVTFVDPLEISNVDDMTTVAISIDNYKDNFEIKYDTETEAWVLQVTKNIEDEILLAKTDLVISLTVTNLVNSLTDQTAVDLILPHLNTGNAPKFSKTYYTARYSINDGNALVTFDSPLNITNKQKLTDISIGTDNYYNYFKITYKKDENVWEMTVTKNLDQSVLNNKIDLVMELTASEAGNDDIGQAVLLMRLPIVNTEDAPKFSSIYYYGTYMAGDKASINLENNIDIVNKEPTAVTISFDDSYKENFDISYNEDASQWILTIVNPLSTDVFKDDPDLILTLTATEGGNSHIGQASLILHLPVQETKLAPRFSQSHYTANYTIENYTARIVLDGTISIVNKESFGNISVTLDSYESNFKLEFNDKTNEWKISVSDPLSEDVLNSTELILTLVATEKGNENTGESTVIISLPQSTQSVVAFSEPHYSGTYRSEGNGDVKLDENIKVVTKSDSENVKVYIDSENYQKYFELVETDDSYTVRVTEPLPTELLETETSLVLTLVAAVDEAESLATLIINLPVTPTTVIRFAEPLYRATYTVVDGKGNLNLETIIQIDTDETDESVERSFSSDTGFESYFAISYANKVIEVTLSNDIPTNQLKDVSFIPLVLLVGVKDTTAKSSAVLNIEVDYNEEARLISFNEVLYHGTYEVIDGNAELTITSTISVETNENDDNVKVAIINEYSDYFNVSYQNKVVDITKNIPLTDTILNSSAVIPLILQAEIKDTTIKSTTIVNIAIKYDHPEDIQSIEFASVLYTGQYSVKDETVTFVVNENINVVTTSEDDLVEYRISEGSQYRDSFNLSYTNHVLSIKLEESLPTDVIRNNAFITLTLEVGIKDTAHTASSVLNINILTDDNADNVSFSFTETLYRGTYEVKDGDGQLTIIDTISLDTDEADDNINVVIVNEYASFFTVSHKDKVIDITKAKPLTDTILNSSAVVPLILQAVIKDTSIISTAVVNIAIENEDQEDILSIEFASILYTGQYSVKDDTVAFAVNGNIDVITTSEDGLVEYKISDDSQFRNNFELAYASHILSIKLAENLPTDVIRNNPFITLTLEVGLKGTAHTASSVLNINILTDGNEDNISISFTETLYRGTYEVKDGDGQLTIIDTISLDTDEPDDNINVIITNEYASFFTVSHKDKVIDITKAKPLTDTILNSSAVLPLILQAEVKDTSIISTAVVNIAIENEDQEDVQSIEFASVLYTGQYSVKDDTVSFTVNRSIDVITTSEDELIEYKISDDSQYRDNFELSYKNHVLSVKLVENLPIDVIRNNPIITLTLEVGIKDTTHTASSVLNINILTDDDEDKVSVSFTETLYHGTYEVKDGDAQLTITETISLDTDESDDNINVVITNEYESFFTVTYKNKVVDLTKSKPLTDTILNSSAVVPLVLQAAVKGTSIKSTAVLNIAIKNNDQEDVQSIEFASVLYTGQYSVKDDTVTFTVNGNIDVITTSEDDLVEFGISDESPFRDYFEVSYTNHVLSVKLVKHLSTDVVKKNAFIALTLVVGIKDTIHTSSSVLNINIVTDDDNNDDDQDDDEDTKAELDHLRIIFIVVTAVLSVLLFACIAGALAYYFLRIRNESYANLEEEGSGRVRFGKTSLNRSHNKSSALEERRPTGFIFNPIEEDIIENSNSPNDDDFGRRKSVAFDDKVEKLEIDSVNDDDIGVYSDDKAQVTHV